MLDYPSGERPVLVLETGRALVDTAGSLIATIIASKEGAFDYVARPAPVSR